MDTTQREPSEALRRIPSLDGFLSRDKLRWVSRPLALRVSRHYLAEIRDGVLTARLSASEVDHLFDTTAAEDEVLKRCDSAQARHHRRIINATGIVLHTGLGRAPLADVARDAAAGAAGYAIVELDPRTGLRNERESAIAELLRELTGAGGALVVNNNAAATTLVLAALAAGREVVVSRGQLVEIGGGFRVPEVMAQAGCRMVEVGTTNRTHLRDFACAITDDTAALMLVHTSNFRVIGFTGMPSHAEVVQLARKHGVHVVDDLGSGFLLESPLPGLEDEPRVREGVSLGVDLTCFSGDKLLGGPQCGIIVGTQELVAQVRAHPLYRAVRCDKLTLAALEATLQIYRDRDPLAEIPTLRMLAAAPAQLESRAARLVEALKLPAAEVVPCESFAGSGANPARPLPSFAVAIPGGDAQAAALRSQTGGPPVFARIDQDRVLLDLRTLDLEDLDQVANLVRQGLDAASST